MWMSSVCIKSQKLKICFEIRIYISSAYINSVAIRSFSLSMSARNKRAPRKMNKNFRA